MLFILGLLFVVVLSTCNICNKVYKDGYTIADCSNKSLTFVPNDLSEDIDVLILDHNRISRLEKDMFSKYSRLCILTLNWNKISYIDSHSFFGLKHLRRLEMSNNAIFFSNYNQQLFKPISNITVLDVSQNYNVPHSKGLIHYPDSAFGVLVQLQHLSIDLVAMPLFGSGFTKMEGLRILKFANCFLHQITNSTFENFTSSVEELHITGCNSTFIVADSHALQSFPNLKVLNLSHSYFHPVQAFRLLQPLRNKTMKAILFRHINDESISEDDEFPFELTITREMVKYFRTIRLQSFDISDNNIIDFENTSLFTCDNAQYLTEINLSRNRISFSRGYRMENIQQFFKAATQLETVDYSYIPLSFPNIQDSALANMNDSDRKIELPKSVKVVRMSHVIHGGEPWTWVLPPNNTLKKFDVSFSSTVDHGQLSSGTQINVLDTSGINVLQVYRQLKRHPLSQLHTIIMQQTDLFLLDKSNENIFQYITGAKRVDISYNFLWKLNPDTFVNMAHLTNLTLSNNLFRAVPLAVLKIPTLRDLDISSNLITNLNHTFRQFFDSQTLNGNFTLHLANNSFVCDCSNAEFIWWLHTTKVQKDSKTYKCVLSNSSESDTKSVYLRYHDHFATCESSVWMKIAVVLIGSFFVIFLPFSIIYNFRWRITFFFYTKLRNVLEKGVQVRFKYDLFVFYNDDVLPWIQESFLPEVEYKWGLKVCIEDRDFDVGQPIADALADAIEQSRHILIIVTPSFANNQWGQYAVERAKYHHFSQNIKKIIVLTKDMNTCDIPHELAILWKDITLIEWPLRSKDEDDVWNKLKAWVFLNHTS